MSFLSTLSFRLALSYRAESKYECACPANPAFAGKDEIRNLRLSFRTKGEILKCNVIPVKESESEKEKAGGKVSIRIKVNVIPEF